MMNVMLISSGLPQNLWEEALLSTNYILNKLPHKKLDKTPYSLWKGQSPSYKYLKVWGCLDKVMVPIPKRIKIGPKTIDCIFISYAINSSAYRFLVHKFDIPDIHVNTIIESRNASFFENIFPNKNACDRGSLKRTHDTTTSDIDHESINDESEEALCESTPTRTHPGPSAGDHSTHRSIRPSPLAFFFRLRESSNPRPKGHIEMGSTLTTN